MRLPYFLLACIGLLPPSFAYADLSLEQARQQAYTRDPELQALTQLQAVDRLRTQQSSRLANPELSVEVDSLGNQSTANADGTSVELRYSQALPLNNKRILRANVAQTEQFNTQLAMQKRSAELAADVRLCLARWFIADGRVQLQQDELAISKTQVRLLSERLRAGKTVPSESQRAVALAQESATQLLNQQQLASSAKAACELLIGTLPAQPMTLPTITPMLDQQGVLSQQQAELDVQRAQASHALATAERRPDVTLSVGTRRSQNSQDQLWLVGASMTLSVFDQNQVAYALSQQQLDRAIQVAMLTRQRATLRVQQAQAQIVAAQQQLDVLQQHVLPATQESLRIAEMAYQAGKTGLLEWLEARQVWRAARERALQSELAVQQALADLEREFAPASAAILGSQP
ncbi:MAG: TolC family protein [Moraxellaceae bacterium]